jgi:peptide/nickel transport system ATP-binding protein
VSEAPITEVLTPLMEVKELIRAFGSGRGRVVAVNRVSLAVRPAEVVALVGESGSGKSTLARMLLRLLWPSSGGVLFESEDLTQARSRRALRRYWRKVQGIFQDPFSSFNHFYSIHRVLANALHLMEDRPSPDEQRVLMVESLEAVGLSAELLDKLPHQLSGGQRQRVMIARALMLRPRLLIADEPTSMLDASLRATILNLLLDIRRHYGMAILFITHDLGQAYYLSDRILVMHRGEVVEEGDADEVLQAPRHSYTRQLLADVPRLHSVAPAP